MTSKYSRLECILLAEVELHEEPERTWYLSFASDDGFVGAVVLKAHGPVTARIKVSRLGIQIKGEMIAFAIPERVIPEPQFFDKLLCKEEVALAFASSGGVINTRTGERIEVPNA